MWRPLALTLAIGLAGCVAQRRAEQRAVFLAASGRFDEAIELLQARGDERSLRQEKLLLRFLARTGQVGRAMESFERLAERLGPENPEPWLELGRGHELAHRYDEALEAYDHAGRVAPRDERGPRYAGRRATRWGRFSVVEPRLREALRRKPNDPEAWHLLGFVLQATGRLDEARTAYQRGLESSPAHLENRLGLATVALRQGEPARALRHYRLLVEERPGFGAGHLGVSWSLMALGRFAEAEQALVEASEVGASPRVIERQRRWAQRARAERSAR